MRFGFISHVVGDGDSARVLRETIELAVVAEEAGFDSFWIAEHHFGAQHGHCPSPLVLAAAVAEHTEYIRLGTAVLVGSLHDPVRLAADAAMVDALSGGRLELGLGAGADAATSARFGRDHAARHDRFAATLDALDELLGPDTDLVPAPHDLRERMWIGTASASGFELAAARGFGVLTGRSSSADGPRDEIAAGRSADYVAAATAAGHTPRVGMSRSVLCADTVASAAAALRPGIDRWLPTAIAAGRLPAGYSAADYIAAGNYYVGDGAEVGAALAADAVFPHASEVLCNVQPAAPEQAAIITSLEILGASVITPMRGQAR